MNELTRWAESEKNTAVVHMQNRQFNYMYTLFNHSDLTGNHNEVGFGLDTSWYFFVGTQEMRSLFKVQRCGCESTSNRWEQVLHEYKCTIVKYKLDVYLSNYMAYFSEWSNELLVKEEYTAKFILPIIIISEWFCIINISYYRSRSGKWNLPVKVFLKTRNKMLLYVSRKFNTTFQILHLLLETNNFRIIYLVPG